MMPQVLQQKGDPRVYLLAKDGEWIYYDPNQECLGSGAMGTVYLGFGISTGRRVAVKRVKDQFANNHMIRERAKLEASLVFNHPNVVQMLGYCECAPDRGPIFILSEYVSGVTLEYHAKNQMTFLDNYEKARRISNEICHVLDGLSCIHSYGIVHRDIKPSNIMLEGGKVCKLMDLGIARLNGGNRFSMAGFIGTPQYSAPEQIKREASDDDIDCRADIYSMGVTLYELLTGRNPFDSETQADILVNQLKKKLPYDELIPKPLFKVLLKATEKEPDKRYQSALELKEALLAFINGEIPHIPDKNRFVLVGLCMVALILLIGLALQILIL